MCVGNDDIFNDKIMERVLENLTDEDMRKIINKLTENTKEQNIPVKIYFNKERKEE